MLLNMLIVFLCIGGIGYNLHYMETHLNEPHAMYYTVSVIYLVIAVVNVGALFSYSF